MEGRKEERERGAKPSGAERTRAANVVARGMEGGDGSAAEGVASAATEGRGWAMTSRKMQQGAAMQGDEANWVELGQWVSGSHLRFAHSYSVSRDGISHLSAISRFPRFAKIVFRVSVSLPRIHESTIVVVSQNFLNVIVT